MRARGWVQWYQLASRLWLTAAALSFVLPASARLDLWLPLHLALAGAVSVAISGAMSTFASALTAAPAPPMWLVSTQFAGVNAGAVFIAIGYPTGHRSLVAAGGACFGAAMLLLAAIVVRARRIGLNKRHRLPFLLYAAALSAIVAGATLGSLIGTGSVSGLTWLAFRQTHMTVNVLGFVSLTIAGTLITLLPTVLRVRMPAARSATAALSIGGVGVLTLGLATTHAALAASGAVVLAAGVALVAWTAFGIARVPRRHFIALSAKHLLAALAWFLGGSIALAVTLVRAALQGGGTASTVATFGNFQDVFLIAFVGGWILQTLLGAWLYLLPTARRGGPEERRLLLAGVEIGSNAQLACVNVGLALLALHAASVAIPSVVGVTLAATGGVVGLAKAWLYVPLARLPHTARRAAVLWREPPTGSAETIA
ncbi:MAG: hypothetical protein ACXVES_06440 [Actinomycetota bacterium]